MARSAASKSLVRSVFEDLCDDEQEAKTLTLRAELMTIIGRVIEAYRVQEWHRDAIEQLRRASV